MKLVTKKTIFAVFVLWLFWMLPISFADALTISDTRIISITDNSVLINWKTDENANSVVNYGKDNLTNSETDNNFLKEHNILLTGLEKNTNYNYQVSSSTASETAIDDNSGVYYQFHTSSEDSPPQLLIDIPKYVAKREVDIGGRTEINTIVSVYVNNIPAYKQTFVDGEIKFFNVDLTANSNNSILIRAEDDSGNINEKMFWVVSDLRKAVINASAIPDFVKEKKLTIHGTVSETALVDIIVNNNPIYSKEGLSFSAQASLEEGENTVVIKSTDMAGNVDEISKTVVADTKKPTIDDIKPKDGSFYYEGKAKDDIEGITEPFAVVSLYYEIEEIIGNKNPDTKKVKIDEVISDANGYFKFKNIDFEKPEIRVDDVLGLKGQLKLTEIAPTDRPAEFTEKQNSISISLFIEVTDRAGLKEEKKLKYLVGTCWSGDLSFDITVLPEYQRPSLLSPERLKEGTEIISFMLNLSYLGDAAAGKWDVTGIDIDLACGRSAGKLARHFEKDPRYNISCRILPNKPSVIDHNRDKTLWFIEYKRLRTEKFKNFSKDFWKDFPNNEIIFPLKVTVKYKEKEFDRDKGKEIWSNLKHQSKCISTAYFVDIPIDPRKILPDFLLEDGIEFANNTIAKLDKLLPRLEKVIEVVGIACIASSVSRLAVKIYRNFMCRWESYKGKLTKEKEKKCPDEKGDKETPGRLELSMEELKEKCSSCASAWNAEAKVYQAYRWTCDRIFCHTTPSGWTQEAQQIEIFKAEVKSRACAGEDTAGVNPLIKKENCFKEYKDVLAPNLVKERVPTCYQYGNDLYIYKEGDKRTTSNGEDVYTLRKATVTKGTSLGATTGSPTLEVIKQGDGENFATAVKFKCDKLCKRFSKEYTGRCMDKTVCRDKLENDGKEGFLAGYTEDCWIKSLEKDEQCCCYYTEQEIEKDNRTGKPEDWNYRDQQNYRETKGKAGYKYPENRYIPGRDRPACFGQDHLFDYGRTEKQIPKVDPFKQHIPAFQCACLTGIRARLVLVKSILGGFANCFEQIKRTGEADAGVCKEMFSMYVCDLLYQVYTWFKDGCIPLPFTKGIKFGGKEVGVTGETESASIGEGFKIGLSSIWDSVSTAGKDLEAEYGETTLGNYLQGGEKAIARKICLAAFGFDVGLDMDSILDMTYTVQFKTSMSAFGARRDFLTYNPSNGLATYEYRTAWAIYPGCDIQDYQVDLICINLEEKGNYPGIDCTAVKDPQKSHNEAPGCGCLYSDEPYGARSKALFRSREGATAGLFVDGDEHKVIEDRLRYDHLRFKLNLKKGFDEKKCFPEGHEDGIFYFPIEDKTVRDLIDCYVDQRGLFRCTRGVEWESRGEAWFETFSAQDCGGTECNMLCYDNDAKKYMDCDKVLFAKGEKITAKVKISGKKKQCIYYQALNEKGEKINPNEIVSVLTEGVDEDYTGIVKKIEFGPVSSASFAEGDLGIELVEGDCDFKKVSGDLTEKKEGFVSVKFKRTATDKYNFETLAKVVLDGKEITKGDYTADEIKNMIFYINGLAVQFDKVDIMDCKFRTSTTKKEQKWKLHAELRYPDADNQCDTNSIDAIGVIGQETEIDKLVRVRERRPDVPLILLNIEDEDGNELKTLNVDKALRKFIIKGKTKNMAKNVSIKLEMIRYDLTTKEISKRISLGEFKSPEFEYKVGSKTIKGHDLFEGRYEFLASTTIEGKDRKGNVILEVKGKAEEKKEAAPAEEPVSQLREELKVISIEDINNPLDDIISYDFNRAEAVIFLGLLKDKLRVLYDEGTVYGALIVERVSMKGENVVIKDFLDNLGFEYEVIDDPEASRPDAPQIAYITDVNLEKFREASK